MLASGGKSADLKLTWPFLSRPAQSRRRGSERQGGVEQSEAGADALSPPITNVQFEDRAPQSVSSCPTLALGLSDRRA